jgi:hypothetical protein
MDGERGSRLMDLYYHEVRSENKERALWACDVYTAQRDVINYSEAMKKLD